MASSEQGKKLSDLLVIDLRTYLKQRQLDHFGTKSVLIERLQQAIVAEGKDPNTYIFTTDQSVNAKMETPKGSEVNLNENTGTEEVALEIDATQAISVLEIDEDAAETNFDDTPMEIETMCEPVEPNEIQNLPSTSENVTKDNDKIELEAEINESFVLMIDELISEKFLEETQNDPIGVPDFVDANETKPEEVEADKEELDDGRDPLDDEPDPLDNVCDPLDNICDPFDEEHDPLEAEELNNKAIEFNDEEINKEQNIPQEKMCNKELIVVVQRENLIENQRKLKTQQPNEMENIFPLGIKIKEEIIELSDDDMSNEENVDFNDIKEEPVENTEIKTNETGSNGEKDEIKSDLLQQKESNSNPDSDKENSSATKQDIYNLKIENLISSVKAQELRQLLGKYGKILEVKVFHDNKKIYCHAFAKVEVKDVDHMIEKLNTLEYKGTLLSVIKVSDVNASVNKIPPLKDSPRKKLDSEEKDSKEVDRNLWVTNLLQNTKAQDIKQLLSQYAKVIGVKVVKSSSDPSKNCYGYVTLESKSDVDLCIQKLDRTLFNGRVIRLSATKKAPVLDSVTEKSVKKSPEKEFKGSVNNIKPSDKKKTLENTTKKLDDPKKEDDKKLDTKKEYDKTRNDRERQREKERIRLEEERIRQDVEHAREILRRQREEARQLEREREKIRKEREYLERQRMEILRMERERQRIEREKIEKEKEELRRQQQRLEEARRAEKRSSTSSISNPSKRQYVSPKRDKPKKVEARSSDNEDFSKRHGEYSKRIDDYSKRSDDYQKRSEEFPKRSSDYHKRSDDYSKRTEAYPRRNDDFPKRFDHYTKPDEIYAKDDYHKRPEFPNYKREDRPIAVQRDYPHSSTVNTGYKFESTYHPDRDKLRPASRKDIPAKEPKPIGYNDRSEITSTEAYRSIIRDDRDRKSGVDYNYKNDSRMPLLKETPRYKDESAWAAGTTPVKPFRDVDPNSPKDSWWRKWDGQWNTGTSTEYPASYNSGPSCPPPPGINNYPMSSHFGNYRKY